MEDKAKNNTEDVNIENTDSSEDQEENKLETESSSEEKDEAAEKINELNDKYLRLYSEFDNYKKRTSKERIDLIKTAGIEIITELLPVIDDFERAIKSNENLEDIDAIKNGIKLIHNKLYNTLTRKGLEPLNSIGQEFNPDIQEAITNIPASSEDMKGKVIDETEKGYSLNGKVIRFAKVIVGN